MTLRKLNVRRRLARLRCFLFMALLVAPGLADDYHRGGEHWAFRPIRPAAVPLVESNWPWTPPDAFLLAHGMAVGLAPAPDAEPAVGLRRLYYALIGLPPSPEELQAFLEDTRPDRWSRRVDRLLASPRFGERWGRHWLDVVRYADSSGGGRSLIFSSSWRYRDYVIDSFNRDTPYGRFVQEQIAGDLLSAHSPAERRRNLIATGFLVIGPNNYETQNKRLLDYDIADEQIETIGRAFLGVSLGCARCHDHKFDPVAMREYYALAGIFLNTRSVVHDNVSRWYEVELPVDAAERARREAALQAVKEAEKALRAARQKLERYDGVYTSKPADPRAIEGVVIEAESAIANGEWVLSAHSARRVGEAYLHDGNKNKGGCSLEFRWTAPATGRYLVRLAYTHGSNRSKRVPVLLQTPHETRRLTVDESRPPDQGVFVELGQIDLNREDELVVTITNDGTDGYVVVDAVQILTAQEAEERARVATVVEELKQQVDRVRKGVPPVETAMGAVDKPEKELEDSPILIRGQLEAKGPLVPRGVPQFLAHVVPPLEVPDHSSGRLELARWLTAPDHPLTWRVYVNRVWQYTFGSGLVRTPDNFGTTGEPPSHPELLDFLAARFCQQGGSTKRLVRELVCSHAFQLASRTDSLARELDPGNRLFLRFSKRRLEAEELRDTMLVIAGTLDTSMGGPSLPANLRKKGVEEKQVGRLRLSRKRSVYQPLLRNLAPEYYFLFDGANTSFVCGRRFVSITPLQALYLLNDESVLELAQATANRVLHEVEGNNRRLELLFMLCFSREPTVAERQLCGEFLQDRLAEGASPEDVWAELAHALFCTVEFRYVE